jgi:hypothetical protein
VRLPRLVRRAALDAALDLIRFAVDTSPSLDYQPLPWLGRHRVRRETGTDSRWRAIEPALQERRVAAAVDVGANVGWFSIKMALVGIRTLAVEQEPKYYRTLLYARRRLALRNLAVLVARVDRDSVQILPSTDAVLFLSVWHHIVRHDGLEAGSEVLRQLWARCRGALFFESGESELPPGWGLPPLLPSPDEFYASYLAAVCAGSEIRNFGRHVAVTSNGEYCQRTLWAVLRR